MQPHMTRRRFLQIAGAAPLGAAVCAYGNDSVSKPDNFAPPLAVFSKVYQEVKLSFEQSAEVTAAAGLDGIDCPVRAGGEILPEHAADEMPRYDEVLRQHKMKMLLITTGITGATNIEVLSGLNQGQEVVTGPYKTLRDLKGGSLLKRDTAKVVLPSGSSS